MDPVSIQHTFPRPIASPGIRFRLRACGVVISLIRLKKPRFSYFDRLQYSRKTIWRYEYSQRNCNFWGVTAFHIGSRKQTGKYSRHTAHRTQNKKRCIFVFGLACRPPWTVTVPQICQISYEISSTCNNMCLQGLPGLKRHECSRLVEKWTAWNAIRIWYTFFRHTLDAYSFWK